VWFDALPNYLTATGYPNPGFAERWPADLHVVGKDISRFHCIFWPAMLWSAGLELPDRVFVHGFLEYGGQRLSKSSGNMIDPFASAEEWGADAIRYLVLREAPFEKDSPISPEQFNARFNADLANGLGNLVSRTLKMVESYTEGVVPRPGGEGESEIALHAAANRAVEAHDVAVARLSFADSLAAIFSLVDAANKHYQQTQPWQLAKDPANATSVAASLYAGLEALRIVAHALWPYMPNVADSICRQLGLSSPEAAPWPEVARWGLLEPGRRVSAGPPLFPRLEPVKA